MAQLDFTVRHPEWVSNEHRWRMAIDIYRGGRHVISPTRQIGHVFRAVPGHHASGSTTEGIDPNPSRQPALPNYTSFPTESYLHSHPRETTSEYQNRINRSRHIAIFRYMVDTLTAATLRIGAARDSAAGEPWTTYWGNVDHCGTPINGFIRRALEAALIYGRVSALTDAPSMPMGPPPASRLHEMSLGLRPYSYLISPLDLVDWQLDEHGQMVWATVREDTPQFRIPGGELFQATDQYRVWDTEGWTLYRESEPGKMDWGVAGDGEHRLGRVPIRHLFARRASAERCTLESDSILADVVDFDRDLFNKLSLLDEQLYKQVFALLAVPLAQGEDLGAFEIGPGNALGFNAEAGQPVYLSPSPEIVKVQRDLVTQDIQAVRQVHGVSRGKAEFSKEERSASALTLESQDKHNVVAALAEAVEAFDRGLHQDVADWMGTDAVPQVSYSRELTLKSSREQIGDARELATGLGVPAGVIREMVKPVALRIMREHGRPDEVIQKVVKLLEEEPEEAPPMPQPEAEADA
ncbi:MAG: hypothetical protein V3W44_09510 [Dehalococcoidales bacterium]